MILRDVEEADLPVLFAYQSEPRGAQMAAFPSRDREAFFSHWRANVLADPDCMVRVIVVGQVVVGHLNSWNAEGRRLIGYWLGEAHWGRGIASAAVGAFLAEHEHTRPLHAFVAVHNKGSRRVLDKNGFRPEGEPETAPDGVVEQRMVLAG